MNARAIDCENETSTEEVKLEPLSIEQLEMIAGGGSITNTL